MTTDDLIGDWTLISACSTSSTGERNDAPYGAHPRGRLIYTASGDVCALISHDGRKPLTFGGGTIDERAQAFQSFLAYAGRYSLKGDSVIHHVEISSIESLVNKDIVRVAHLQDDQLILTTPATLVDGKVVSFELAWRRLANGEK
jgi:hypothetical protein